MLFSRMADMILSIIGNRDLILEYASRNFCIMDAAWMSHFSSSFDLLSSWFSFHLFLFFSYAYSSYSNFMLLLTRKNK
jgi:hypothetical protein